jgi:hypothetical protein
MYDALVKDSISHYEGEWGSGPYTCNLYTSLGINIVYV